MLPPGTAAARFPVVCGVAGRNRSTGDGVEQELDLGAINCLIAQCVIAQCVIAQCVIAQCVIAQCVIAQCVIAQCVGDQCVGDQLRGRSVAWAINSDSCGWSGIDPARLKRIRRDVRRFVRRCGRTAVRFPAGL